MKVSGLFSGKSRSIGPKHNPTGIFKYPVEQVSVNTLGIIGDIQADKRFHGGPEKALHQFSLLSYEKIIKRFPLLHKKAQPGAIGENISAPNMHEHNVCIGDIYQLGSTVLQVSSPRIPCWKIDAKLSQPDLNQFISQQRLNGWYYRVLESGEIGLGEIFQLQQRPNPLVTIDTMLKVIYAKASASEVDLATHAKGLDPEWKKRLNNQFHLA
jgi:MOSC domain-containing protein YiiM